MIHMTFRFLAYLALNDCASREEQMKQRSLTMPMMAMPTRKVKHSHEQRKRSGKCVAKARALAGMCCIWIR